MFAVLTFVCVFLILSAVFSENPMFIVLSIVISGILTVAAIFGVNFFRNKKKSIIKDALYRISADVKVKPCVNINKAEFFEFNELPGLQGVKAKRMIWTRRKIKNFKSVDEFIKELHPGENDEAVLRQVLFC